MQRNFANEPFTGQLKLCLPPQSAKTVPLMDADQVNKIPPGLLNWTWSNASDIQDLGDITIVTVKDETSHLRIQRVVEWILRGEEASFFAKGKLEIIRTDEHNNKRSIPYDAKIHANDMTCRATYKSHACFTEELEVYRFSVDAKLAELSAALSRRLCSQYPVYVAELVTLFKTLPFNGGFVSVICVSSSELRDPMLTCVAFATDRTPLIPISPDLFSVESKLSKTL
jgi:hypothetical protein